jgi:hypothetical protein
MNRAAAVTYLTGLYGSGANALLSLADMTGEDTTGNLKEPIDDALLLMGTAYDDLATATVTSTIPGYLAALRYTALRRIIAGLNAKSQQGVAQVGQGVSLDVREWIKRLQGELAAAAAEARQEGVAIGILDTSGMWPTGTFALTGINLDYLEPVETV